MNVILKKLHTQSLNEDSGTRLHITFLNLCSFVNYVSDQKDIKLLIVVI